MYKYKISVIVPVYNTEDYLDETIKSIVCQTIGFRENIQLILVNNATQDNSGEICELYQKKYPDNISYLVLEQNCRPSGARNEGLNLAEGKYVNFIDSDDKWSLDAFEKILPFFEEHYEEVDAVTARVKFFEALEDWHPLDEKSDKNEIVDLQNEYSRIRSLVSPFFFKREIAQRYNFQINQISWEDTKYVYSILLNNCKYGIVSNAVFYYRKRIASSSASQNNPKLKAYYLSDVSLFCGEMEEQSIQIHGCVIPAIQYLIAYFLGYRFRGERPEILSEAELTEYKNTLFRFLDVIEDKYICEQTVINKHTKIYMLIKKQKANQNSCILYKDGSIYCNNNFIFKIQNSDTLGINYVGITNGQMIIEGRVSFDLDIPNQIYAESNEGNVYAIKKYNWLGAVYRKALMEPIWKLEGYSVQFPIGNTVKNIRFFIQINDEKVYLKINYYNLYNGKPIDDAVEYCFGNSKCICQADKIIME